MFNLIKARRSGAESYWDYFTLLHNPYIPDTWEFEEWENGFYEARAIDNGDT